MGLKAMLAMHECTYGTAPHVTRMEKCYTVLVAKAPSCCSARQCFANVRSVCCHSSCITRSGVEHLLRDVKDATISTLATDVSAKLLVGMMPAACAGQQLDEPRDLVLNQVTCGR